MVSEWVYVIANIGAVSVALLLGAPGCQSLQAEKARKPAIKSAVYVERYTSERKVDARSSEPGFTIYWICVTFGGDGNMSAFKQSISLNGIDKEERAVTTGVEPGPKVLVINEDMNALVGRLRKNGSLLRVRVEKYNAEERRGLLSGEIAFIEDRTVLIHRHLKEVPFVLGEPLHFATETYETLSKADCAKIEQKIESMRDTTGIP